ncbi:MAG TPA: MBL fold metallo-hydrolase [Bryobacteraceae bacterium]|nr:MBL fold metallo-hydrolase [Bryobacteraceae bacterium]
MRHSSHRRGFLRNLVAGAAGVTLAHRAVAATPLEVTKLTDTFLQITGAGGNVLAVLGPDSVLLVNGGSAERSQELLQLVSERSGNKPVRVLFNTCWHPLHTGSNEALGKAGAKIIAHENTKLWLGTEIDVGWQKRTYEPHPKQSLPNQTFYTGVQKMMFGQEPIEYGYMMQAHTDGDIYVYFPGPNILAAGDVVASGSYPIVDYSTGGWLGGMLDGQKALLKVTNADTRIVPGNGPLLTHSDLEAENQMLATLKDQIVKLMKQGMGPKEIIAAAPTKDFDAKWGNPDLFIELSYRGLWGHVRELGGIV